MTVARVQAMITIGRDVLFLLCGLLGIAYQQVTGRVNAELLVVYASLLGVPGVVGLVQLSRGRPETPDTVEPSSASQSSS